MTNTNEVNAKRTYTKPTLRLFGDIRKLTLMPGKDFGVGDGWWLHTPDQTLCNLGECSS